MPNLVNNHTGIPFQQIQIQPALNQIKNDIENAIVQLGEAGKNALIRSQRPIKLIHDVVKTNLMEANIHVSLINPALNRLQNINPNPTIPIVLEEKELCLAGYLKTKKQDVSVIPNNIYITPEILTFPTYLNNFRDEYGADFTESTISINVRSQLSSVAKNFDTLYERTIAESLNFHLRFPSMVLGEVYLIIAKEYNSTAAANHTVQFRNSVHVEKYILAFQALNDRNNRDDSLYKYERVALLIVDFSCATPKLYNTTQELINDGLIPANSLANIDRLSFNNFVNDILRIYQARFPANSFI